MFIYFAILVRLVSYFIGPRSEENVYKLIDQMKTASPYCRLFVVFISNPAK